MIELYINNAKVDTANDASLPLKWQSNIFGDVSKIVGNKSATINLPITANNREIFAAAELPATDGAMARRKLPARCVIDGVQVFGDGYAVLLAVGSTYEIALTWGVLTNYNALVADDVNLNEIDWWGWTSGNRTGMQMLLHSPDKEATRNNTDWRWLDYLTEVQAGGEDNVPPFLPSILVGWLLDNIATHYGVTLDIPAAKRNIINQWAVLLTTAEQNNAEGYVQGEARYTPATNTYTLTNNALQLLQVEDGGEWAPDEYDIRIMKPCTATIHVQATTNNPFSLNIVTAYNGFQTYSFTATQDAGTGLYTISEEINDIDVERFMDVYCELTSGMVANVYLTFKLDMDEEAQVGDIMPLVPNFPSITPIDLLKEITMRVGLFAVTAKGNTLKFISPDQLVNDAAQLLPDPISVEHVSFSYGDYAQRNYLDYDTDEGGDDKGRGTIAVNDETLEHEKVLFESYFGLQEHTFNLSLYDRDEDETEWQYKNPTQRLGRIVGTSAIGYSLSFQELLAEHYTTYQNIVAEPVVVRCKIHIPLIEVVNLDIAKSVYINKLGRRYAILSIEMENSRTFNFELIQI